MNGEGVRRAAVAPRAKASPRRLSSVASALRVLKAFSAEDTELGISAIAERLGLAKSTVHRLSVTLSSEGFLEQNEDNGRYRLGMALFELGARVRHSMDVSNQARPVLGALRDRTGEAVHLAVMRDTSIMYLYNLESSQAIGFRSYIGARRPAFCTSEGLVLLAFAEPEVVAAVLAERLIARTPRTNTSAKALLARMEEVRALGHATDDEESEIGMRSVAAPIRDLWGRVVASASLAGPTQRLTKKVLREFVPQVVAAADEISRRLGFRPG